MSIGTSFAGINPVFLEELRALQREFAENAEEAENWSSAVMLELLRRQAQLVVENLQAFDVDHQGKLYESGRNLAILEDIARGMSAMNGAARENVQAEWARRAMDFRQRVQDAAPALGIQLDVPKFFGTSIQLIQGASLASFSALSDYAQLQGQVILALKTETAEGLSRGLTTTELQRRISQTGIGELPEISGVRRAFSVEERARMIARTETLRIQTQIQRAFAEVAGLEFGRSFLNWFLTRHHELCLWAEAIGWAPVTVFQSGPGFPPRHPSCVTPGQLVSGPQFLASTSRWYEGIVVEISTERDQKLTITPNHPILTPKGWIAAGCLNERDDIICCLRQQNLTTGGIDENDCQIPVLIEEIANTIGESQGVFPVAMPISTKDFHGDGLDSQVCIVRSNCLLGDTLNSTFSKPPTEQSFRWNNIALLLLAGLGSVTQMLGSRLAASNSSMGSLGLFLSLLWSLRGHDQCGGLRSPAGFDSSRYQPRSNSGSGNAISIRQSLFRFPLQIPQHDIFIRELDSLSGRIPLQSFKIKRIRRSNFVGHVYNLQTKDGYYNCNGYLIHNCGCTWQAADAAWLEANKDELHIQEFTQNLQANNVKLPAFVLDAIPANVGDLLRASRNTFQINDRRTDIPQRPTESRMLAIDEETGGVRVRP